MTSWWVVSAQVNVVVEEVVASEFLVGYTGSLKMLVTLPCRAAGMASVFAFDPTLPVVCHGHPHTL